MSSSMRTTRSNGTVEVDAQATPTDDGRVHVSVAVIRHDGDMFDALGNPTGVMGAEPWYEDTLDTLTQADLDRLADEALAAHADAVRG